MTFSFISLNYYSAATLSSLPLAKEAKVWSEGFSPRSQLIGSKG